MFFSILKVIVPLQHCVNFSCAAKWPSHTYIYIYILFLLLSSIMVSPKRWDIVPFSYNNWPQFCFSPSCGIIDLLSIQQAHPEFQQSQDVLGTHRWGDTKSLCRCLRTMTTYSWDSTFLCHLSSAFTVTCPLTPAPRTELQIFPHLLFHSCSNTWLTPLCDRHVTGEV